MNKKVQVILLILVFFLAFFLRFYKLGEIPNGLYQDESAIGYNAYSILETGRDEHGKFMPLYFKSFGDWKLPVYIYVTVVPIKILGLNEFAVRFPSAFFGSLTVILFYFFIKEIIKEKKITIEGKEINVNLLALLSSILLAINPWSLHYNRATFEVSISLFLFLLGGFILLKAFNKESKGLFFFGTVCFILSFYSYNLTRLLAPIFYLLFLFSNKRQIKNIKKIELMSTFIVSFFLLLPFIKTFFDSGGVQSAEGTLIISSAQVKASILELRSFLINLPQVFVKIFFNVYILTVWQYVKNIISYLSVSFFFISGSSHGNHGIGNVGQFFIFELPFIAAGFFQIVSKKYKWGLFLLGWGALTILVAATTRESPHATRSFFLVIPLEILSAYGFLYFLVLIKKINKIYSKLLIIAVGLFIAYNLLYYFVSYYVRFPVAYAKAWRLEDKALSFYLKENDYRYEKIIFDQNSGFIYTSLLFYLGYPPNNFQNSVKRLPDDSEGFSKVASFGKYEFKDVDWEKDLRLKNVLIITNVDQKPKERRSIKTFYYPTRPAVYSLKEKIIQMPVREEAYVLIESNK